jgi:hypothetical protein
MVRGVAGGINYGSYGSQCLEDFETGRGGRVSYRAEQREAGERYLSHGVQGAFSANPQQRRGR